MDKILIGLPAFIFILGAAVVIHEFGHFIVAKLLGIRVETFSVGFGKRLWGRKWGTTDYRLSLIPLGGYVKLGGDESNAGIEEGGAEPDIPAGERFDLRPRWQKFLVGVAGPVMNVLTAIAIPFVAAMTMGVPATPSPVVALVDEGGAAQVAGLRPGDRIVAFKGEENPTWRRISGLGMLSPDIEVPVVVERGGERVQVNLKPTKHTENGNTVGDVGFDPDLGVFPVSVFRVRDDSPAAKAGLTAGDRVISVNDQPARNNRHVVQTVAESQGPIRIKVERDGRTVDLVTTDERIEERKLGFELDKPPVERVDAISALSYSVDLNLEILRLTGHALGQVFTGQRSVRETFSGPVEIAVASSDAAYNFGWEGVFEMLAFLSLNLGVFNLLPIPVLDGGMIFMLLVEGALAVVGLKLSLRMRERIQQVGFVFLLLLMGFVIINDITKLASRVRGTSNPPAATQQQQK
jgi:regulator of sigma E protease